MNLPSPLQGYDRQNESQARSQIEAADAQNQKRNSDIVIKDNKLIFVSPDGTRWSFTVDNDGNPALTPL